MVSYWKMKFTKLATKTRPKAELLNCFTSGTGRWGTIFKTVIAISVSYLQCMSVVAITNTEPSKRLSPLLHNVNQEISSATVLKKLRTHQRRVSCAVILVEVQNEVLLFLTTTWIHSKTKQSAPSLFDSNFEKFFKSEPPFPGPQKVSFLEVIYFSNSKTCA